MLVAVVELVILTVLVVLAVLVVVVQVLVDLLQAQLQMLFQELLVQGVAEEAVVVMHPIKVFQVLVVQA
jgi:hypothetical protein